MLPTADPSGVLELKRCATDITSAACYANSTFRNSGLPLQSRQALVDHVRVSAGLKMAKWSHACVLRQNAAPWGQPGAGFLENYEKSNLC